ncbi:hypothetical protein Tco_1000673, partial [Tanacetum coccineum]
NKDQLEDFEEFNGGSVTFGGSKGYISETHYQVKQNKGGIFISQDKYVAKILKKFDLVNVKAAITPMEIKMPLTKDEESFDVDVVRNTKFLEKSRSLHRYR